jgi:2'-5' RNA ligase
MFLFCSYKPSSIAGSPAMPIVDPDHRPRQGDFWCEQSPDSVFFSLYPDRQITRCLSRLVWQLRGKHRLDGMPRPERSFHVSLCGVGAYAELPCNLAAAINQAASTVAMLPFRVSFDRVTSFGCRRNRALVLVGGEGVVGVQMLQRELAAALNKIAFLRRKAPPFNPHLTLLYYDGEIVEQAVEEIQWTVREFVLVRSLHGQSRHVSLKRWSLK